MQILACLPHFLKNNSVVLFHSFNSNNSKISLGVIDYMKYYKIYLKSYFDKIQNKIIEHNNVLNKSG